MIDYLGQTVEFGDFVVIKTPYGSDLALGRVKKVNPSSAGVCYIPNYIMGKVSEAEKQALVDFLCSSKFSEDATITLHNDYGDEFNFRLNTTVRLLYGLVKVSKDQIENFVDRWLSYDT